MVETTLQIFLDRTAISDLVIQYARSLDSQNWQLCRSCFTDEIEMDYYEYTGKPATKFRADEFIAFNSYALSDLKTQHLSTNHQITLDGDKATCVSNMVALHHRSNNRGENFFNMHGYYTMNLVRTVNDWKIQKIKQSLHWCEGNPTLIPVEIILAPGTLH